MTKSNHLMAVLSVWGILLVVLGHSGFEEPIIQQKLSGLHAWIYSFHMPLFFLISGFLFSLTNPVMENACKGQFIWKKTKRLIVPYMVLGTILFVIKYLFTSLSHTTRMYTVANFFKMFIIPRADYSTIGHLWYVFALYSVFLLVLGMISIRFLIAEKKRLCLIILGLWIICFFLPRIDLFNLSIVLNYLPYFILGIMLQRYYKSFSILFETQRGRWYKGLVYLVISVGLLYLPIHGLHIEIIRALTGILFSLSLCDFIIRYQSQFETNIVEFSKKTYTIYLLSWFGQYIVKFALVNVLNMHYLIVVVGMFAGGLIFPLVVCWLVDIVPFLNNKVLRLIIGY